MNETNQCPVCGQIAEILGGYSICCDADPGETERIVFRPGNPSRERSSKYRGVCEVYRRKAKTKGWRAITRVGRTTHHIGESTNPVKAARMYDNALYYLHARHYLRAGHVPTFNFPDVYMNADNRPEPFAETERLIRKLESRRAVLGTLSSPSSVNL